MMIEQIKRHVDQAMGRVRMAFRALGGTGDLARGIQLVNGEGMADEQLTQLELFQHFGFTSALPAGTQLIVLPLGGRSSHAVVVATEAAQFRFVVDNAGEVAIYSQWGDVVHLKQDRSIHVKAELKVLLETPLVECTQDMHVMGQFTCDETVTANVDCVGGGISLKGHKHGGVQAGGSQTGIPS